MFLSGMDPAISFPIFINPTHISLNLQGQTHYELKQHHENSIVRQNF